VSAAPDYIEPVVGWRLWYAVRGAGPLRLSSVFHKTLWPVGKPLAASCLCFRLPFWPFNRSEHEAPGDRCRCGIYAANVSTMRSYLPDHLGYTSAVPVIGRVSLWGVVHECTDGWRAGFAYPERLYVPTLDLGTARAREVVRDLRAYGVPVVAIQGANADSTIAEVRALAAA
jgi:hypothetical protein